MGLNILRCLYWENYVPISIIDSETGLLATTGYSRALIGARWLAPRLVRVSRWPDCSVRVRPTLTLHTPPGTLLGAIPARKSIVPWDDLAKVEASIGQKLQFPAEVTKLNGRSVVIEGHMMTLDDDDPLNRFLLTAYQAHCPYCMPGGFTSIVAIHADHLVRVTDKPLTMRGTLRLLADGKSQLFYQLDKAVLV